jgi:cell shape-determining protein MreD
MLGFIIDIFCNTPGINAAATTLIGFLCRPVQGLFFMIDDYDEQTPGLKLLGGAYMKFAFFLTLIHHIVLISIESFSYFNIKLVLIRILLSTVLTTILIFAFEGFSLKQKSSWQKST